MIRQAVSTSIARRSLLKATAALVGAVAAPAIVHAQQPRRFLRPLVAGLNGRQGDPTYDSIARIPQILRERHNVQLEIQVHASSTLGTDLQQMEAVQTGFIDITSNATAQFQSFHNAFTFVDLPYAITSWDMYDRLWKSPLWQQQAAKFEERVPVKVLPPVGGGGFRVLWNKVRALPAPAQVNGVKFRTTNSQLEIALIRGWGGNATPMAWTETYNALASGVVEGIHVQPIWTYGFHMHENLKYGTEVDALFAVQFQVMNRNTWNSMPAEIQTAFMAAATEAAEGANAADRRGESEFKQKLREARMELYTPSAAEKQQWQRVGEGLWEGQGGNVDRAVLQAMTALR